MLTYRVMYKFLNDGVHAEVLDFPGVISCGRDLEDARRLLQSALVDMAETQSYRWASRCRSRIHQPPTPSRTSKSRFTSF